MAILLEEIAASADRIAVDSQKRTPPPTLLTILVFITQLARNQRDIVTVLQNHINEKGEHWR